MRRSVSWSSGGEEGDGLRHAFVEDGEVFLLQAGDWRSTFVLHDDADLDEVSCSSDDV